jgi:hypothetical protein
MADRSKKNTVNKKVQDLEADRQAGTAQFLTTNQGLRINENQKDGVASDVIKTVSPDIE